MSGASENNPRQITLTDIAKVAGLTKASVSLALRNNASVSRATQLRIQALAKSMGYRPNPLVSTLMTYRRAARQSPEFGTIALITNFATPGGWRSHHMHAHFAEGASKQALRLGYKVEEFWLRQPGMTAPRLSRILYQRNITGVLVAPLPVNKGHLRLDWSRVAAVALGCTLVDPVLHRVDAHVFRAVLLAYRKLRQLGYQKIGLATPSYDDERVDHQLVGALLSAQHSLQPSNTCAIPPLVVSGSQWTLKTFRSWFDAHKPDVVMSIQPEVQGWIVKIGRAVPEECGFIHLNCSDRDGPVSGIFQHGAAAGEAAVDMLVPLIQRNEFSPPQLPRTVFVEGCWVEGGTVRR